MTPIQTMLKFDNKHTLSAMLYERLQSIYTNGLIQEGFFTNEELLKCEYNLITTIHKQQSEYQSFTIAGLHLFAIWRNNKSIFRFDENLAVQVISARVPSKVKASLLQQIPHWGIYIELPVAAKQSFANCILDCQNFQILGFWAIYDKFSTGTNELVLMIYLHVDDREEPDKDLTVLEPIKIPITSELDFNDCAELAKTNSDCRLIINISKNTEALNTMLSLLLCLCVKDLDVTNVAGVNLNRQQLLKPRYKHIKRNKKFEPSIQPHYYEIGLKEGNKWREAVRKFKNNSMIAHNDMYKHITKGKWIILSNDVVWQSAEIR